MVSVQNENELIPVKGNMYVLCWFLNLFVASTAGAELGAIYMNTKDGEFIRLILEELGHPQPPTPIHYNNKTAAGIANDTMKKHQSHSMEMRFSGS